MKVTITKKTHNGKMSQNRKEDSFYKQLTVITRNMSQPIVARFYSTGTRIYACVWIGDRASGTRTSGGGFAGGGGYHKPSAALDNALLDAGIELSENIAGVGDAAMSDALTAIASALGYRNILIHEAHA